MSRISANYRISAFGNTIGIFLDHSIEYTFVCHVGTP
jgi:hypothetical protein